MQKFERMRRFFYVWSRALFQSVGHDIYCAGGFKAKLYTYYMWFIILMLSISALYTIIFYDWFTRLNVAGLSAIAMQLIMKIYSIRYADIIVTLVDKLVDIFKVNSKVTAHGRQEMLERYLTFTEYLFKIGLFAYVLASCGYFLYPFYCYVKFNEVIPILPTFLPFIDEDSTTGFAVLTVFHFNLILFGTLGCACSDFSFTMVIVNVPILSNIIGDDINEMNKMLNAKRPNFIMIKAKLRNILLQHRETAEFIDSLDTTFFKITFVQISSGVMGMSALLFLCLKDNYPPAYGFALAFFFQIVSYCAIGTVIEVSNDNLYDSIIRGDWYLMPCADQMKYQFLMQSAQNAKALTVGGINPLNMRTCVTIFKMIYSYLMILYTFVA